jgi:hypothetical protein
MINRLAIPLLLMTAMALGMGMTGGLQRLGWDIPPHGPALILAHGPLMICGFFASLIAIERAVALGRSWAWCAPALIVIGSMVAIRWPSPGMALLAGGTALLAAATFALYRRQKSLFNGLLLAAVLYLLTGDAVWWFTRLIPAATAWWMLGLILTITAERLELTRLLPRQRHSQSMLLLVIVLLLSGAVAATSGHPKLLGLALLMLGLWLLRYDIARRNLRMTGLPRFVAICLCAGYAWLIAAGVLFIASATPFGPGSSTYDAALHAVFLGFVFSMVFGHAPIIIPAITRLRVPFHPTFYAPLALLHGSLALRIGAGITGQFTWRLAGGSGNAVAILLFLGAICISLLLGRRTHATHRRARVEPASPSLHNNR